MHVVRVDNLDDPRLAVYRSLRRIAALKKGAAFVAEGARLVRKLLATGLPIESILLDEKWLEALSPALEAHHDSALPVYLTSKDELQRIIGYHVHQGVMAVARAPQAPPLNDVLSGASSPLLIALAGVSSHDNVGGILRTAAGFGATGMLLDRASCDPFVRRAARTSMGAIFALPIWRVDDLPATLIRLRDEHGIRSLAAHVHEPYEDLPTANLSGGTVIVLGAEGTGVPDDVVAACDASVRIPMDPSFDCFNVATAAAIIMYEVARQRSSSER